MKILGIDPGMSSLGLALIEDGVFKVSRSVETDKAKGRGDRLRDIHDAVADWLHNHRPDVVALEGYAMGARFGREQMGEAGGAIRMACARYSKEPVVWQVKSWQKTALGSGALQKDLVTKELLKRYGIDFKTTHESDAFGVAMAEWLASTGAKRPQPKRKPAAGVAGEVA